MKREEKLILWLSEVGVSDGNLVGGKNSSLGEMFQHLSQLGILVPPGFAVTVKAYQLFLEHNELKDKIIEAMKELDPNNLMDLARRGTIIRKLILDAELPPQIVTSVEEAYIQLNEQCGVKELDVAVRSSATTEDLPDASFAGQQETYLNIRGVKDLLEAIKKCFASLFTNRAISYRYNKDFDQVNISISVAVQQMIRSDSACSGVIFTIDTETGFQDTTLITAGYGLGEAIVQGHVTPDEYYVYKPFLRDGVGAPIISKKAGNLPSKLVYSKSKTVSVKMVDVPESDRAKFVLTDSEILELARYASLIEDHYSALAGVHRPMDVEWAKDGDGKKIGTGKIFIIQARPETVQSRKDFNVLESYVLDHKGNTLVKGQAVGSKIGKGKVCIILKPSQISNFDEGGVLVTEMTDPDWEPIMRLASAIVTDRGGRTCHAAIVSRELGVPCVIGTEDATKRLSYGRRVTVDCSQGEIGVVYDSYIPFRIEKVKVSELQSTKTRVTVNVGNPEAAFMLGQIPNDGVGIAAMESIVNNFVAVHPYLLLNYEAYDKWIKNILNEESDDARKMMRHVRTRHLATYSQIQNETLVYPNKIDYLYDRLTFGVARIAASFYPKSVIIKLTDPEVNGFLMTSLGSDLLATHTKLKKKTSTFDLECQVIKKVRSEMKFRNVKILLPQMEDPEKMDRCLIELDKYNLRRGKDGLEILATISEKSKIEESMIEKFDGFSFILLDELTDASRELMRQIFQTIKKHGREIGYHSQAFDDFKTFAPELIDMGVDSICLFPESLIPAKLAVAQKEKELKWIS